jgi:ArsR family transcriptional regulator, arsenate/arsenite/antimonite-responsive transcriptional repressor
VDKLSKNYGEYAVFMKALADETRVKIFDMLSRGELCACNILEEFNITQPTLSYHMRILCDSGLVNGRRDGVWMKYSINKCGLESLKKLFDNIGLIIDEFNE